MPARLFGTDGVRGLANELLTAPLATSLGVAAARVLVAHKELRDPTHERPFAIVGRDPRASGEFLQAAVSAGLASAGVDVIDVGIVPTPAVAYLTDVLGADLGCMLSASHNAMPDNGIKFFARGGVKLDDAIEDEIESQLDVLIDLPTGASVGRIRSDHGLVEKYVEHLVASIDISLAGITVVVDAANGAASAVSPEALRRAGANVIAIHCEPTGYNINADCGSTHLESLQSAVREHGAAAGIAHDGDADRCLAIDENGEIVDGDQILAIIAAGRKNAGTLVNNTVVATVMSNLGFNIAMQQAGIEVVATAVGDRYVLEAMREHGYTIGGEQSGHLILAEYATTGDGTLTALALLAQLAQSGVPMSELASIVTRLPQVLINVRGVDKALVGRPELTASVEQVEARLAGNGRVLLRPSGTEPVIRVMVEAATEELAQSCAQEIADLVAGYCSFDASS